MVTRSQREADRQSARDAHDETSVPKVPIGMTSHLEDVDAVDGAEEHVARTHLELAGGQAQRSARIVSAGGDV